MQLFIEGNVVEEMGVGETTTEEKNDQKMNDFIFDSALVEPIDRVESQEIVKLFAVTLILYDSLKVIVINLVSITKSFELFYDVEGTLAQCINAFQDETITVFTCHVLYECLYYIFHIVRRLVKLIKRSQQVTVVRI